MRSAIIIVAGLVFLAILVYAPRLFGRTGAEGMILGAKLFIPLWFIAAAVNLWIGVAQAGYTFMDELPIFLAIFGIPAAVAAFVWWKLA
jgi:hypothetical protein